MTLRRFLSIVLLVFPAIITTAFVLGDQTPLEVAYTGIGVFATLAAIDLVIELEGLGRFGVDEGTDGGKEKHLESLDWTTIHVTENTYIDCTDSPPAEAAARPAPPVRARLSPATDAADAGDPL